MANISSAYGTITFESTWTKSLKDLFIQLFEEDNKKVNHYSIFDIFDNYGEVENQVQFSATGRWAYIHNLNNMQNWLRSPASSDYEIQLLEKLVKAMEEFELTVDIEFTDEESSCGVLYTAEGIISPGKDEYGKPSLVYLPGNEVNYDLNRENLLKLEIYDGFETEVSDVVDYLKKHHYPIPEESIIEAALNDYPWLDEYTMEDFWLEDELGIEPMASSQTEK